MHWWTDTTPKIEGIESVSLEQFAALVKDAPPKRRIDELILHHSWKPTAKQYKGRPTWEGIDRHHEQVRGWTDIGYHGGTGADGSLWLLRPLQREGGHCLNHNAHSIGWCMIGNYDTGADNPRTVLPVTATVFALLCIRFKLGPENVHFHREFANKTCPGSGIRLEHFRDLVSSEIARLKSAGQPVVPVSMPGNPETIPGRVWQFETEHVSGDILAEGIATTWWDHQTRTGVPADTPGLVACSLPRGLCDKTLGSPFTGVPDFALVRVWYAPTNAVVYATVIDEGPSWFAEAGTKTPGSAMIDLTVEAKRRLGFAKPKEQNAKVRIRIYRDSAEIGKAMVRHLL